MQRPASPTHRRLDGLRVAAAAVLVGVATTALAWWRLGPTARSTVWAEDGGLFLRERIALGPVDSLLHPYAGYLHLVPRLLVDVAWALPVQDYARALSAGACVVVGAVSVTVFLLARDVVPQWPLRALLAAVPALLPLAPYEISGNAANLHWYMLFAAPWLFAYRARTWWASGTVAVLTAFAVLTELQTVLFLPLLLLAWFPLRNGPGDRAWPRAVPVTIVALIGAGAQVGTALTDQRSQPPGRPAFTDVVAGWLLQPVAGTWTPDVGAAVRAVVTHGWGVVLVPVLLVAATVVVALVVGTWRARWVIVALAAVSGGVWWAALIANGGQGQAWAHPIPALAAVPPLRYAAASGMLLLAAVVVAASVLLDARPAQRGARPTRRGARPAGALRFVRVLAGWSVVAVLVVAVVGNLAPGATRRSDGPVWATQVPGAVAACAGDPTRDVEIRKAPWTAKVPCSRLLER
ncbi:MULTISPECIES: hypothetical protein [unclassified Curtobacterium]|uniref:hypothetical protein n=1 Tax=unclassified Curtobacterium TaxID=257496 RepID=UPI001356CCD2|nr:MULTISPECIES: hypothetical protein [unclassified Curtobacterium]MBF4586718.1 hypothetical protein [Curtobacterium sp. VKM Ac-2887]